MNSFLRNIVLFTAALSLHAMSLACSCRKPDRLDAQVAKFDHVFSAVIVSSNLSPDGKSISATLSAEETSSRVPTITAAFRRESYIVGPTSCPDAVLSPGMHVVVFASDDAPTTYGFCSPTRVVENVNDPLLESLRKMSEAPGRYFQIGARTSERTGEPLAYPLTMLQFDLETQENCESRLRRVVESKGPKVVESLSAMDFRCSSSSASARLPYRGTFKSRKTNKTFVLESRDIGWCRAAAMSPIGAQAPNDSVEEISACELR